MRKWGTRRAESARWAAHWSADVVQMILVLGFFIVVPKVPNGMVLSFVSQFSLLDALMGNKTR
jgi:hypothetical protein